MRPGSQLMNSIEDFLFHFGIRRYLCKPNEHHITDWSKSTMSVERAGIDRARRYDKWYSLLIDEIDLVSCPMDDCSPSARRSSGILFGAGFATCDDGDPLLTPGGVLVLRVSLVMSTTTTVQVGVH